MKKITYRNHQGWFVKAVSLWAGPSWAFGLKEGMSTKRGSLPIRVNVIPERQQYRASWFLLTEKKKERDIANDWHVHVSPDQERRTRVTFWITLLIDSFDFLALLSIIRALLRINTYKLREILHTYCTSTRVPKNALKTRRQTWNSPYSNQIITRSQLYACPVRSQNVID